MHNCLRQFRQLFHPQRKGIKVTITRFAETDKKQRLVRALQSGRRTQSGEFSHESHEMDARHFGDKRIALGHVSDQGFDLVGIVANIAIENPGRT